MVQLKPAQSATLKPWFLPDRPGMLFGLHALFTGHGRFYADRWPAPRAILVAENKNYSLAGDPGFLAIDELRQRLHGVCDAPRSFLPLLKKVFPDLLVWDRIVLSLEKEPTPVLPSPLPIRRLNKGDSASLAGLSEEIAWICNTWGGNEGLAGSGFAWGAFNRQRLVAVACTFFVGESYEEVGIVTEEDFRERGLGAACAQALCRDIFSRGRRPSWSTGTNNVASIALAEKLGFRFERYDNLYVVNGPIPA